MAKSHFFPSKIADQRAWLVIFVQELPTVGPTLGMTPEEINACVDAANAVITAIDAADLANNVYKQAVADKDNAVKDNVSDIILPAVKRFKTSSGYTEGIGQLLGVEGSDNAFDPDTYRPKGSAKVLAGEVKLSFTKAGADGVVIYSRIASGDGAPSNPDSAPAPTPGPTSEPTPAPPTAEQMSQFTKLALDHHSPYVDNRPLARPGVPEVREYYMRGLLDDVEIGLPGDIIRVVVGV